MPAIFLTTTHRELVENLVLREIKTRYKQSILGYAWTIANPFLFAVIYTVVGNYFLHLPTRVAYVYYGLLFWNLFATGLATATESLVAQISLITKVYFPREVFPIASVLSKVVDFGFGLVGMIPILIFFKVAPSPLGLLLTVPLLGVLLLLTTGLGMLTACANLFYRDIRYIVGLATNLLMYLVPNLYVLEQVPEKYRPLYLLNPVATIIEATRRLTFPEAGHMRPLLPYIALATVFSLVVFVVGFVVFKRNESRFAEFI